MTERLTAETVDRLIAAAVRAPSSHNTQPWAFRCERDRIELYADRTRALPVNDPFDRELTISCGAALVTLCIAAEAAGFDVYVERFPSGQEADLLAAVTVDHRNRPRHAELAGAIPRRQTHRGDFRPGSLSPVLVGDLIAAAADHDVVLEWIEGGEQRETVARLVGAGDRAQFADSSWRRELASWMRPRHRGDGLAVPRFAGPATRLVVTHLDLGGRTAAKDEALVRDAPLLGVLATDGDEPTDWLRTGEGLGQVLLVAAAEGVQAGFSNQACQVPHLRGRLREALGLAGTPQVLVRFGVPVRLGSTSPRRPGHEVLSSAVQM